MEDINKYIDEPIEDLLKRVEIEVSTIKKSSYFKYFINFLKNNIYHIYKAITIILLIIFIILLSRSYNTFLTEEKFKSHIREAEEMANIAKNELKWVKRDLDIYRQKYDNILLENSINNVISTVNDKNILAIISSMEKNPELWEFGIYHDSLFDKEYNNGENEDVKEFVKYKGSEDLLLERNVLKWNFKFYSGSEYVENYWFITKPFIQKIPYIQFNKAVENLKAKKVEMLIK